MGISVNSRSSGANRISAFARTRLIDVDERLPTKYPTLYGMTAPYWLISLIFSDDVKPRLQRCQHRREAGDILPGDRLRDEVLGNALTGLVGVAPLRREHDQR